jgi:hypothetical protein
MLSAALFGASGGIASAAPGPNYKDETDVTPLANDGPLVANTTYQLSYNSSGNATKASGGGTLSGPNVFLGWKTQRICQDANGTVRIINLLNQPKKGGNRDYEWIVISIVDEIESVDLVPFDDTDPACEP